MRRSVSRAVSVGADRQYCGGWARSSTSDSSLQGAGDDAVPKQHPGLICPGPARPRGPATGRGVPDSVRSARPATTPSGAGCTTACSTAHRPSGISLVRTWLQPAVAASLELLAQVRKFLVLRQQPRHPHPIMLTGTAQTGGTRRNTSCSSSSIRHSGTSPVATGSCNCAQ